MQYEQAIIKQEKDIEKLMSSLNLFKGGNKVIQLKPRIGQNNEVTYNFDKK